MSSTVKESSGGLWNLPSQLAFYRSYHHDPINVLIHAVFIPTILYTSTGILANVQLPSRYIPDELKPYESYLNLGSLIIGVGYAGYYLVLDWHAGIIAAPALWLFVHTNVVNLSSFEGYNNYLWAGFVIGWIVQFIGHGFFERRAPALLDNLLQALVLAPFFVVFEAIFLLGFRSELRENMEVRALENIKKFKETNKKKL